MLVSQRLILRPLSVEDAPHFYALNEDPEVMRYVPDRPFTDEAEARQFLHSYFASQPTGYGRMAVIREADQAWLGWCGLKYHPKEDAVDLGYRFFRKYWGQGFATESACLSLQYGFKTLRLLSVYGHVAPENMGSVRVLEKCGFVRNGAFTEPDWSGLVYTLDKERWLKWRENA